MKQLLAILVYTVLLVIFTSLPVYHKGWDDGFRAQPETPTLNAEFTQTTFSGEKVKKRFSEERLGQRLYQFFTGDGRIGYILQYKLTATDGALASHGNVERDECGRVKFPYSIHSLCARVDVDSEQFKVVRVIPVFLDNRCYPTRDYGDGRFDLEATPQNGTINVDGKDVPYDAPPLNEVILDVYVHPIDDNFVKR